MRLYAAKSEYRAQELAAVWRPAGKCDRSGDGDLRHDARGRLNFFDLQMWYRRAPDE